MGLIQNFIPQAGHSRCSASGWRQVKGAAAFPARFALPLQRRQV